MRAFNETAIFFLFRVGRIFEQIIDSSYLVRRKSENKMLAFFFFFAYLAPRMRPGGGVGWGGKVIKNPLII